MSEQLPFLAEPYAALADVYDIAGFSEYSLTALPRYIAYAQSLDWAGRRVLDVGCGTGATTWWMAQRGYRVIGVDANEHMVQCAQASMLANFEDQDALSPNESQSVGIVAEPPDIMVMDIRELASPMGEVDLVVAVGDVLNSIQNLRELEIAFRSIHNVLAPGKLFIFDMITIRGLAEELGDRHIVLHDNGFNLMVVVRSNFSYETLSNTRHYTIFQQQGLAWSRQDEIHTTRGYPTQGVVALLQRTGFEIAAVLTPQMEPFDLRTGSQGRAAFIARKAT